MNGLWIILVLGCLALALSPLLRQELNGPGWLLLRPLFPSWRFFEETDAFPTLYHRVLNESAAEGPWQATLPPEARPPSALVINSRGNQRLAAQSLVERLAADAGELNPGDGADALVSYELVTRLVRSRLFETQAAVVGAHFQFKITSLSNRAGVPNEDLLISAPHEV